MAAAVAAAASRSLLLQMASCRLASISARITSSESWEVVAAVWAAMLAGPQEAAAVVMGGAVSQPSSTPVGGPSGSSNQVRWVPSEK